MLCPLTPSLPGLCSYVSLCVCVCALQPVNRAIIWDRIVTNEEDALIDMQSDNEYTINDQFSRLRGRELKVTLHYDVMPIVGLLHTRNNVCSTSFTMPENYM